MLDGLLGCLLHGVPTTSVIPRDMVNLLLPLILILLFRHLEHGVRGREVRMGVDFVENNISGSWGHGAGGSAHDIILLGILFL